MVAVVILLSLAVSLGVAVPWLVAELRADGHGSRPGPSGAVAWSAGGLPSAPYAVQLRR